MIVSIINRTTTNIELDDEDDDSILISEDTDVDSSFEPKPKKKQKCNSDQFKLFQDIANDMKQNQNRKMELLQQVCMPRSELELFFASMCKTVEKFTPLDQAKVKSTISRIVGEIEIENLEKKALEESFHFENGSTFSIESLPIVDDVEN